MKQRLVGAIVLGCLAIIFLPILLDGEGASPPEMNTSIPAAPPFPEPLEIEPRRPVLISDSLTENTSVEEAESDAPEESPAVEVTDAVPVEMPTLDSAGLPQAWSVRLGMFSEATNAENLVNQLMSQNYRAYSEEVVRSQGNLNAVFVGPVLTRAEAENLRDELAENFALDGIIIDFEIDENQ